MTKKTGKGGACPSFFFNTGRFPSWFTKDLPMVAKLLVCIGFSAAFLLVPHPAGKEKPVVPVYRVVLDPGHGGANVFPVAMFGDRYDRISKSYLEVFREGSQGGGFEESVLMYRIAVKVSALLKLTESDSGWETFRAMVSKYSASEPPRVVIQGFMSRKGTLPRQKLLKLKDPNHDYRLFDFPSGDETVAGRISVMNRLMPQLVVSFHCAQSAAHDQLGMSSVICAPYSFMAKGLEVLQHKRSDASFFHSSKYSSWFEERSNRSLYRWFLSDTSMYFLGYPLNGSDRVNAAKFKGYRYNMVSWPYRDPDGWEKTAASHPAGTRYASSPESFLADGPYWDRERSKFEEFRRDGGPEGFGGDNLYGGNEILRYTLTALAESGYQHPALRVAEPFLSVWSVPLYINAISAYVELGYLREPAHQKMFREKLDVVAEGIAVGIYSLLAGTVPKPSSNAFRPKGEKLNLDKYRIDDTKTYFEASAQ